MSAWSDAVAASSPYLWWKLDETTGTVAADASGNGNAGTYDLATLGQPGLIPGDAGGKSVLLSSTSANILKNSGLSFNRVGVTYALTFKTTTDSTVGRFFNTGTAYLTWQSDRMIGVLGAASTEQAGFSYDPSNLCDGNPHFVVWVVRATSMELWVDGVRVGTGTHSATAQTLIQFQVKQAYSGPTGTFDDALVWTTDLSASQVESLSAAWGGSTPGVPQLDAALSGVGAFMASTSATSSLTAPLAGSGTFSATVATVGASSVAANLTGSGAFSAAVSVATPPAQTDTSNRVGGRIRSGYGIATWTPAVVPSPTAGGHAVIKAQAFGPVAMQGTQPTYTTSEAHLPRDRHRIIVGGVDVTYFRGVPTPAPSYQLGEPLLWGPGSIEFPQIAPAFDRLGRGALKWLRPFAPVLVQRVNAAGEVTATDYRGFIAAFDTEGASLRVELGGHGNGRAVLMNRQAQIFTSVRDVGRFAWRAMGALHLPLEPRMGPVTGVEISKLAGGMTQFDYIRELCRQAQTRSGKRWTILPDDRGVYAMTEKDTTTVHATAFADDARIVASLRRDGAEEPNRIFATAVTPEGKRLRFAVYPGLKQGTPPEYPFSDGRTFGAGTTNGDTDSGEGIVALTSRLRHTGYLGADDQPGGYDRDVTVAVKELQADAELPRTGDVDPATWAALFDLDVTGAHLGYSQIQPVVQRSSTRRWRRSASGAIIGRNPGYDRRVIAVDRNLDFGSAGFWRGQVREYSRTELDEATSPNWHGTVSISTGAVLRGEVAEGAAITAADVMDARDLRPGMNLWLPQYDGGTLVHISGVQVDGDGGVTLTVDTRARDALEVWEVINRNRETRRNPARSWSSWRSSTEEKDSIIIWDDVAGFNHNDVDLVEGWNVIEVVGGQAGTVQAIRVALEEAAEFTCAFFGARVSPKRLNHLIPDPLTQAGTEAWEKRAVRKVLDERLLLYSAGTKDEPCGYSPGRKSGSAPLRGVHRDEASFSYSTPPGRPIIYLAVYVRQANVLKRGRIMWAQLEAGV